MWTYAFDRMVAPARERPQVWRLLVCVVAIAVAWISGPLFVVLGLRLTGGPAAVEAWLTALAGASTPQTVLLVLASFAVPLAAALCVALWLHGRRARDILGPGLLAGFVVGAGVTFGVNMAAGIVLSNAVETVAQTPVDVFLRLLPLALAGLALQTGAEEVIFRGYLQPQLAARFANPAIWLGLPAILFGALHYDPSAGGNALWVVATATLFGLIAGDLTRVTGSIGAAWGWHFVNNAVGVLIVSLEGPLSGLALHIVPEGTGTLSPVLFAQDMALTVIVWACIRLWLTRRRPDADGRDGGRGRDGRA